MTLAHRLERWPDSRAEQPASAPPNAARRAPAPAPREPARTEALGRRPRTHDRSVVWVRVTLTLVVAGLLRFLATVPEPRPTRATVERERAVAELRWTLAELRAVISDYRLDHGAFPGSAPDGVPDPDWFVRQLTLASNRRGETAPDRRATHPLGPYEPAGVPTNPINAQSSVRFLKAREPWPSEADGATGWTYRPATGEIRANAPGEAFGTGRRYWDL